MHPRIEHSPEKKLVGQSLRMSLANNRTAQLWRQFAPRIPEIRHRSTTDKISMQIYPPGFYEQFNPTREFEKWAAVEVESFAGLPPGMQTFTLPAGLYAVFDYRGSSADPSIFQYIFSVWLPQSNYVLADRPHFEVLGPRYKNDDPDSEEEIWIPVQRGTL